MSISNVKDRKGNATDRFKVELMRDGKRIQRYAHSIEEARAIERQLKGLPEALVAVKANTGMTLGQLETHGNLIWARKRDKDSSRRQLSHVVKALGADTPLRSINYAMLMGFANTMLATPVPRRKGTYDPKTVNRYLAALSAALRWAVKHDCLDAMPKVPKLEESEGRVAHLRASDDERFLAWLRDNWEPRVAWCADILAATGMRVSELLGLTEANLEPGWIRLAAEQTKTKTSRYVPLTPEHQKHLEHMVRHGFPSYRNLHTAFTRGSEVLGLPDRVTPHVLRHTTATRLTAKKVPTVTVMRFLGHKNIQTTLKYAHVQQDDLRAAQALLTGAVA